MQFDIAVTIAIFTGFDLILHVLHGYLTNAFYSWEGAKMLLLFNSKTKRDGNTKFGMWVGVNQIFYNNWFSLDDVITVKPRPYFQKMMSFTHFYDDITGVQILYICLLFNTES